ncbi:MAG: hypothetical protein CO163_00500, partial [Rhodobacterales bacterium CG_4_9_14_3_um_filter_71_31]
MGGRGLGGAEPADPPRPRRAGLRRQPHRAGRLMARRAVTPLGVLRNPSSSGNRGRAPRPAPPGVVVIEARSAAETPAALAALRAAGVVAVVVDGGDGTVRETATHLAQAFGGAPPPLGVLPHGNTNLIARSLGALADEAALAALAARLRAGRLPPTRR